MIRNLMIPAVTVIIALSFIFVPYGIETAEALSASLHLSDPQLNSDDPQLAIAQDGLMTYTAWISRFQDTFDCNGATSSHSDVFLSASPDGTAFNTPKNVSHAAGSSANPQIMAGGSTNVYL